MPQPKGTKYRFRKLSGGREQRLAFGPGGKVREVVNYMVSHGKAKRGETVLTGKK